MVLCGRKPDADDGAEWKKADTEDGVVWRKAGFERTCEMKDGLWLLAGVFLLACAYSDIRSGMISVKCCLFAAGAGMLIRILCVRGNAVSAPSWERLLRCLLPGLFVMGIAAGSGEQIGKGDAWILLTLGVLVGMRRCVSLFVAGLVISLPFAAVWHLIGRRRKKEMLPAAEHEKRSIPFAPSLLLAHLMLSFLT